MKRMWLTTTLVLFGLVQALVGWNEVCADDAVPSGDKLLPKDTLLYFSVPSVPEAKQHFEKSLAGSLLNDKEFKPFIEDVQAKITELSNQLQNEIGVSISDLLALPQGEVTFAVLERPARKFALVLMVDYGDNAGTVEKLLKELHDALDGDIAEHSTEDVSDIKIHVYTFKDEDAAGPIKSLSYLNDKHRVVFSSEVDGLKEVIERWDGKSEDTLASSDVFKYIREQCKDESGEPSVVWYLSPIGLIQAGLNMAQSISPQVGMAGPFLPMLGVDKLKGFGGATYGGSSDFDSVSKTFMYVDQPAVGLVNVFQFPATELTPPKWVSAEVGMYMGANWNLTKAYQAIESLVDMFQGRGALARLLDQAADRGPGIHIKKDVLDLLDGKFHMIQAFESKDDSTPVQQFLFAFEVKDAAKMKKTLSKIAKSDTSNMETREFNGETIYEVEAPNDQVISVAVASGQLVLTNDTPTLEGMLRTESQPSLDESPAYRKISKFFPGKASMIAFQRSDAQLKVFYDLLKNADDSFVEGIDVKKLPAFEVLQKYLRPSGSYTVPDKKGSLTISFELREGDR